MRFGAARLPDATRLHSLIEDFFLRVTILPWDSDAARQYGQLRATLEREGRPMGNLDMMIGAHALALGAVLVSKRLPVSISAVATMVSEPPSSMLRAAPKNRLGSMSITRPE